jgi:PIN domain nuclease of toxin-antitoxin system
MKKLLLDTHVLLWCLADSPRLKRTMRELIDDSSHIVYVSTASIWEISIKQARGKLQVVIEELWSALATGDYHELPITARHAWRAGQLPPYHQDPFDRMLVAQALTEKLTLVTHDNQLKFYDVPIIWV